MRENDVTPSNVMEIKIDVTKNQNGVRTALTNVTRFRPVNLLQNKTRFFSIAYIGELVCITIKVKLIKHLYNSHLRKLPIARGEVSVMI